MKPTELGEAYIKKRLTELQRQRKIPGFIHDEMIKNIRAFTETLERDGYVFFQKKEVVKIEARNK